VCNIRHTDVVVCQCDTMHKEMSFQVLCKGAIKPWHIL
jgi:hypothetical protein